MLKRFSRFVASGLIAISAGQADIAFAAHYTTIIVPVRTGPVAPPHNSGQRSLYLQCDGKPAIMSDTEKFARLMGAITLLGIFAPRPEVAEPGARLFAEAGVEACSALIDGADQPEHVSADHNILRRVPLILARAAHQIEAKNYTAAIADVHKARDEAAAAHLVGNPYFDRSMGLSFDQLESIALVLSGDATAARDLSLRHARAMPYSFFGLASANAYAWANTIGDPIEDSYNAALDRLTLSGPIIHASRLEFLGRFEEAATLREITLANLMELRTDAKPTIFWVQSAIALAMAGQWDLAKTRADQARKGIDDADTAGKPDQFKDQVIECLDFFQILVLAHDGKIEDARRNFAARSAWSHVGTGAVLAETEILRKDARPEQLFGALAVGRDKLQADLRQHTQAQMLKRIADNQVVFGEIISYAQIDQYEQLSKPVWNTDKSAIIAANPALNSSFWPLSTRAIPTAWSITRPDALLLHAALQAKARGYKGFVYSQNAGLSGSADVLFGNPGEPTMPPQLYLDADAVIAELRQVIPSPTELAARRAEREKQPH